MLDSALLERDSARHELVRLGTSSAAYIANMRDTALMWLGTALSLAQGSKECPCRMIDVEMDALLHLAFIFFEEGNKDKARGFLRQHLQVHVDVRRFMCRGCRLAQSKDTPMLTCGGCGVARFCNKKNQQIASKIKGNIRKAVLHKDICSLLKKWRHAVKVLSDKSPRVYG